MGLLCDYFVAGSDDEAAATIDWSGGPGAGPPETSEPVRRGLFRRRSTTAPDGNDAGTTVALPTVDGKGIDPVVQMGTLEAQLTGRSYDDVIEDDPGGRIVAERDGGERLVLRLNDALVQALSESSEDRLAEAAEPWSETEEFWGQGDAQVLTAFLVELARLALHARTAGQHMYCWVSV